MGEKEKKPDKREYTLMMIPHHGQKVRSVRIPIILIKYTLSILCLLVIIMMGTLINYRGALSNANMEKSELVKLRQSNGAQSEQLEKLAEKTAILQSDMDRLNSLDAEIRRIVNDEEKTTTSRAGIERSVATSGGQGGARGKPDINDISNLVNDLQSTMKVRSDSLGSLKQELLARKAQVAYKPSIWPTSGDITSRFGWRESPWGDGGRDWHPGIDIANNAGTPVVATADGDVTVSEVYGGYGNMVEINHGNGIVSIYGHNSQLVVHAGEKVKKGQVISYMGNTGYSTGPHVHYEIRVNGTAVNPASFLN